MTRDEVRQIIWQELNRALNLVLTGQSQDADGYNEKIVSNLAGASTTPKFPVAYPFGLASKAPDKTPQLTLQMGNTPLSRVVASHFDNNRPTMAGGEVVLYNAYGQQIRVENGKIRIGGPAAAQPFVLGTLWKALEDAFIAAFNAHTHDAGSFMVGLDPVTGTSAAPSAFSGDTSAPLSTLIVGE